MVQISESEPIQTRGHLIRQKDATLYIDEVNFGKGCLVINEKNIIWTNDQNKGIFLNYLDLGAHGISRDKSRIPEECLCLFYNKKIVLTDLPYGIDSSHLPISFTSSEPSTSGTAEDGNESDNSDSECTNIYFAPKDKGTLDSLYHSIKEFQKLNPDPDEPDSFDGEEEDFGLEDGLGEEEDGEFWQPSSETMNSVHTAGQPPSLVSRDSGVDLIPNNIYNRPGTGDASNNSTAAQNNRAQLTNDSQHQIWSVPVFDADGQLVYNPNQNETPIGDVNMDEGEDDDQWVPPGEQSRRR